MSKSIYVLSKDDISVTNSRKTQLSRLIAEMKKHKLHGRYQYLMKKAKHLWCLDKLTVSQRFNIASWVLRDIYKQDVKRPIILMHFSEVYFHNKKIKRPENVSFCDTSAFEQIKKD